VPSLKLSNLFRRDTAAPTLRERAASLRVHISPRGAEVQAIGRPQQDPPPAPVPLPASSLAASLDLASATVAELRTVDELAQRIGSVAFAYLWGPRCQQGENTHVMAPFNAAGVLMRWIGDALTAVEAAVDREARRRVPGDDFECETRLALLASTIIDNGDDAELEAFARELLAHAVALREGR